MNENIKIIDEVNQSLSAMIEFLKGFIVSLEKLKPKVIEEKVMELEDGDIYEYTLHSGGGYYLLERDYGNRKENLWSLRNLKMRNVYWALKIPYHDMKR